MNIHLYLLRIKSFCIYFTHIIYFQYICRVNVYLFYTARKKFIFTYVVEDTFLSNTPFEFCGGLSSFLRYAILKFYTYTLYLTFILICIIFSLHSKYVYIFLFTFTEVIFLKNFQKVLAVCYLLNSC